MHLAIPKSINLNHAGQTSNVPERHRFKLERTIGPFFGPFVGPLFGSLYLLLIVRRGWVGTLLRPCGGGGEEGAFINKCS